MEVVTLESLACSLGVAEVLHNAWNEYEIWAIQLRAHLLHDDVSTHDDLANSAPIFWNITELFVVFILGNIHHSRLLCGGEALTLPGHQLRTLLHGKRLPVRLIVAAREGSIGLEQAGQDHLLFLKTVLYVPH